MRARPEGLQAVSMNPFNAVCNVFQLDFYDGPTKIHKPLSGDRARALCYDTREEAPKPGDVVGIFDGGYVSLNLEGKRS